MKSIFKLNSPYKPAGSQPEAIAKLTKNRPGKSTLVGVTGSGKTFTMANVIASQNKPVLISRPIKHWRRNYMKNFPSFSLKIRSAIL